MNWIQILIIFTCKFWTCISCFKDVCQTVFDYQEIMTWDDNSLSLWHWLDALENLKFKSIATKMISFENQLTNDLLLLLRGPYSCNGQRNNVLFNGNFKFDKDRLVTGTGKVSQIKASSPKRSSQKINGFCYSLDMSVTKIKGQFSKGKLLGKGTITYSDKTKMEANLHENIVHGPVLIKNTHNTIQAFGYYHNGQAHGPFWFTYENTFLQVHFCNGYLVEENVILVDSDTRQAKIGLLRNGTYLSNLQRVDIKTGKYRDAVIVKVPRDLLKLEKKQIKSLTKLPIRIIAMPSKQRLMIRPSRIMYFNRVAKTGSFNMLVLMQSLGVNHGYDVDLGFREVEVLQDNLVGLQKEVDSLIQTTKDTLKARHYAFFDIRQWGYDWAPDWFSIVRHPIERVSTFDFKDFS